MTYAAGTIKKTLGRMLQTRYGHMQEDGPVTMYYPDVNLEEWAGSFVGKIWQII